MMEDMDVSKQKDLGKIVVSYDIKQLEEYKQCLDQNSGILFTANLVASTLYAIKAPIKNTSNALFKRFGVGVTCFIIGTILTRIYSIVSCYPVLCKIKNEAEARQLQEREDGNETLTESRADEISSYAPLSDFSSLDISPSMGLSLDYNFKPESFLEDKNDGDKLTASKPSTYEELRLRSKAELRNINRNSNLD